MLARFLFSLLYPLFGDRDIAFSIRALFFPMHSLRDGLGCCILALLCSGALSLRFSLNPGERRCFTDDLPTSSHISASVLVTDGKGAMDIDVWVTTTEGRVLYHKRAPSHGSFSFETTTPKKTQHSGIDSEDDDDHMYGWVDETYRFCIEHQRTHGAVIDGDVSRLVSFEIKGSSQNMRMATNHAKVEATDKLTSKMVDMHHTLNGLLDDLAVLQQRERALVRRVGHTTGRVSAFSALSVCVALVTSALQYKYFKTYFQNKKLC